MISDSQVFFSERASEPLDSAPLDALDTSPAEAAAAFEMRPEDLAAQIAGKLCHDFISPTGAILSGIDMMNDPANQDMREEFLKLIDASARKLAAIVHFARVAYGASTSAENFSSHDLEALAQGMFAHLRGTLIWDSALEIIDKPLARVVLNLALAGGAALPTGGEAKLTVRQEAQGVTVVVDAKGPRARLKGEAADGYAGRPFGEGLAGQWITPHWTYRTIVSAGGELNVNCTENQVVFTATFFKPEVFDSRSE